MKSWVTFCLRYSSLSKVGSAVTVIAIVTVIT